MEKRLANGWLYWWCEGSREDLKEEPRRIRDFGTNWIAVENLRIKADIKFLEKWFKNYECHTATAWQECEDGGINQSRPW